MRRAAVLLVVLALAGCGDGSGDAGAKVADARVEKKQAALEEARAGLDKSAGAFCQQAASYLTALDRYGDVLTTTAPTVGDVQDAGTELAEPRSDVIAAAEQVRAAKEAVATAEQELASLTSASPAVSASAAASAEPDVTPSVSTATVERVKQADADFTTAQQGVSAQTPVKEASEQFNSAAVALEMAWIRLFDEAGCLTGAAHEQARAAVRDYTLSVQKSLAEAGYYQGEVDGVYGPGTTDAVAALQKAHGLPTTGTVDKATDAALQADLEAKGGSEAQQATASAAAVQQTLKLAGHWPGPVDGEWTPALTEALKAFQTELGVKPTGAVDAATIAAVQQKAKPAPSPSAS